MAIIGNIPNIFRQTQIWNICSWLPISSSSFSASSIAKLCANHSTPSACTHGVLPFSLERFDAFALSLGFVGSKRDLELHGSHATYQICKEQPLLNQWNTWHGGKHRTPQASLWAEARFRRSLIPRKTVSSEKISVRGLGAQRSSSRRGSALEKPQTFEKLDVSHQKSIEVSLVIGVPPVFIQLIGTWLNPLKPMVTWATPMTQETSIWMRLTNPKKSPPYAMVTVGNSQTRARLGTQLQWKFSTGRWTYGQKQTNKSKKC